MMYVWFPLSLLNVEDLLQECGIDVSHETIRFWWNKFRPIFSTETPLSGKYGRYIVGFGNLICLQPPPTDPRLSEQPR